MKTLRYSISAFVFALCFLLITFGSYAAMQSSSSQPNLDSTRVPDVVKPTKMPGVYFLKTSPSAQPAPFSRRDPPHPNPLKPAERVSAINQIRGSLGLTTVSTNVPAQVVLTPLAPKSGLSYYNFIHGSNFAVVSGPPFSLIFGSDRMGDSLFVFNTVPGKSYMVDFTLSPRSLINLQISEGYNSSIASGENGHLIIGFKASGSYSRLSLSSKQEFRFYSCELTQVDKAS